MTQNPIDIRSVVGELEPLPVDAVWKRWEPRFVACGADYNIVKRLKAQVESWNEWSTAWSAEADKLEAAGDDAFVEGRTLTAGQLWSLASLLHHFGGMYYISDMDQFERAHDRSVELFAKAAPLLKPPAKRIVGTLGGNEFAGYLQVPESDSPPPVAILFNGFEGTKEESQQRVAHLHERGLATLSWDGPGRGESWPHTPMTGDYGPATGAMIDALEREPSVDASRIGAVGPNRGGFFAFKAATTEPRIKALAITSPGYDRRGIDWKTAYQEAFNIHLFHLSDADQLRERVMADDLTLSTEEVCRVKSPTLIIAGDQDSGEHYEGSKRLYAELEGTKQWAIIKGSERNGNNVPYIVMPMMADFLAMHL